VHIQCSYLNSTLFKLVNRYVLCRTVVGTFDNKHMGTRVTGNFKSKYNNKFEKNRIFPLLFIIFSKVLSYIAVVIQKKNGFWQFFPSPRTIVLYLPIRHGEISRTNTTIDTLKEKDKYFMLDDNALVSIVNIV